MDLKRSTDAYSGVIKTKAANGQTLVTPVGKDSSDWTGGKGNEVPKSMKLGGSMTNLSDTLGKDAVK